MRCVPQASSATRKISLGRHLSPRLRFLLVRVTPRTAGFPRYGVWSTTRRSRVFTIVASSLSPSHSPLTCAPRPPGADRCLVEATEERADACCLCDITSGLDVALPESCLRKRALHCPSRRYRPSPPEYTYVCCNAISQFRVGVSILSFARSLRVCESTRGIVYAYDGCNTPSYRGRCLSLEVSQSVARAVNGRFFRAPRRVSRFPGKLSPRGKAAVVPDARGSARGPVEISDRVRTDGRS